jgi:hypothetical protein
MGFQSIGEQSIEDRTGYAIVYREYNDRPCACLRLWDWAGQRIRCEAIAGEGVDFTGTVDAEGGLEAALPAPFTYALYRYRVLVLLLYLSF